MKGGGRGGLEAYGSTPETVASNLQRVHGSERRLARGDLFVYEPLTHERLLKCMQVGYGSSCYDCRN